ncbi:zinc finger protein 613-like [Schistocerca serialis cubense]|uniref:zinc finger protein 613-like n=1 Tax=Schistocerca serialis cubense TaxID=2023355 RepID=UPI00214DF2F6|nr:zinc finger protein 613-like [Schistocerca serialis cubense]
MNEDKKYKCSECGRSYNYNKNLRKHVLQAHPGMLSDIAPELKMQKCYKFLCRVCGKQFNQKRNLMCHERNAHASENSCIKIRCALCDISVLSKKCYYDHLSVIHDVSITSEETEFASFQEFGDGKQQTEKKTMSFYVKKRGAYCTSDNVVRLFFVCHRSGQFLSKSKGIRNMKTQGTNKIGGVCPSSLEVTETRDGSCKVKHVITHVGHQNVISYLDFDIS